MKPLGETATLKSTPPAPLPLPSRVQERVALKQLGAAEFAERITLSWQQAVASIIETGRLLREAKQDLKYGDFGRMVQMLPFSDRTAQRLMAIAANPVLSNPTHVSHLPPSWGTLHRLTMLPEDALEEMLNNGRINCETQRKDIDQILEEINEVWIYKWSRLRASLDQVIAFMRKYPDPKKVGAVLNEENIECIFIDLDELSRLPAWLEKLHAAATDAERPDGNAS